MSDQTAIPTQISFDYLKGSHFRAVHVDGAIGGRTPIGFVHMALYSERFAIPQRVVHNLNLDGSLGDAVPDMTVTRGSVVRELEIDLIMSPDVAESIAKWLLDCVNETRSEKR